MDKPPQSRGPLFVAIVLLLLPVLYVGSYLALVVPGGALRSPPENSDPYDLENWLPKTYRFGNSFCRRAFWPLEQIDRKLRPEAWDEPWDSPNFQSVPLPFNIPTTPAGFI